MKYSYCSIFCHTSSVDKAQKEIERQYKILSGYAQMQNFQIEHCFLHEERMEPDTVMECFLQAAKRKEIGVLLIESGDDLKCIPLSRIPRLDVYLLEEKTYLQVGDRNLVEMDEPAVGSKNSVFYSRKCTADRSLG